MKKRNDRTLAEKGKKHDFSFSALLENKKMVRILSVIVAFIIWAAVSTGAGAIETKTVRNVPIDVDVNGNLYQTMGLKAVEMNIDTVDVQVTGPRYVIGSISASDIRVTPVINEVTDAGFYTLALRASLLTASGEVTVHSLSSTVVSATFDTFETRTFELESEAAELSVAAGYIGGQPTLSIGSITVHGPTQVLNTVDHAAVRYSGPGKGDVSRSFITDGTVVLLDADGTEINSAGLELSAKTVQVSVPVLKKKTVKPAVTLYGAPEGYAERYLTFSPEEIEIAGVAEVVDGMSEITVATLDVSKLTQSTELTFALVPGGNVLDVNHIGSVSVSVDYSKVKSGEFTVRDLRLDGTESVSGYEVTLRTQALEKVTVYAASDLFGGLSEKNLYAVASLDATMAGEGQKMVPVKVYSEKGGLVWAVGEYTVLVDMTKK